MSEIVIRSSGLSKKYRIGALQPGYGSLREALTRGAAKLAGGLRRRAAGAPRRHRGHEEIWALRDVSFEVARGDVLGVLGRNGAGKSTLLKVLSRITRPTAGWAEIRGSVGSLLEVGTGFHPELTGRENVFLSGAVLGMSRREIQRRFDEIVAFAEVEEFLDTPVKRYSSGMYVRLAFAVAAHFEPDVLIVDEVLAVGDAAFQQRSLGKLNGAAREGRTVLFVSHNMHSISTLCKKAIWLEGGSVRSIGTAAEMTAAYMAEVLQGGVPRPTIPVQSGTLRVHGVRVADEGGRRLDFVDVRKGFCVEIDVVQAELDALPRFILRLYSASDGVLVMTAVDRDSDVRVASREPGAYVLRCHLPGNLLNRGVYAVSLQVDQPEVRMLARHDAAAVFSVVGTGDDTANVTEDRPGYLSPLRTWSVSPLDPQRAPAPQATDAPMSG